MWPLEPKETTVPTVGFSSADFKLLNFKVTAYDVGGGPRIRGIWKDYYAEVEIHAPKFFLSNARFASVCAEYMTLSFLLDIWGCVRG